MDRVITLSYRPWSQACQECSDGKCTSCCRVFWWHLSPCPSVVLNLAQMLCPKPALLEASTDLQVPPVHPPLPPRENSGRHRVGSPSCSHLPASQRQESPWHLALLPPHLGTLEPMSS